MEIEQTRMVNFLPEIEKKVLADIWKSLVFLKIKQGGRANKVAVFDVFRFKIREELFKKTVIGTKKISKNCANCFATQKSFCFNFSKTNLRFSKKLYFLRTVAFYDKFGTIWKNENFERAIFVYCVIGRFSVKNLYVERRILFPCIKYGRKTVGLASTITFDDDFTYNYYWKQTFGAVLPHVHRDS